MMNRSTVVAFIATRGIGKTWLSAVFSVIRCILYPGTKICIASGRRSQSVNVLDKILLELKPDSPELALEIDDRQTKITTTAAQVVFKNGSYIKVVTASDSARGNRANLLVIDEFRMVDKDTIDTVLRKFLTQRRTPRYSELTLDQRRKELDREHNMTMYLSSAYYVDSWAYQKCKDTFRLMLEEDKRQFVCGLPYQLSLYEGLLDREVIEDEMAETDFSEFKFMMEYEALWYGNTDGAFFDYDSIAKNRHVKYPLLPERFSSKIAGNSPLRIPPKLPGERRLLSADIALMSSKKHRNDATSVFINQMLPTKAGRYTNNIVYCDAMEGLHTEDQALALRKLFDEYNCDYIVLDTQGVGLGVFDALARDISDPETGELYPALSCCNDQTMADRCSSANAPKVIWSIKANAAFNSDCAILLREGFRTGRIRLLVNEYDGEANLSELKGYNNLLPQERLQLSLPYLHTSLLIDEVVKLQHEESNGRVRIFERAGMRKDRYSSLAYNYYVATKLETRIQKRENSRGGIENAFVIKAPNYKGKAVSGQHGRSGYQSWR